MMLTAVDETLLHQTSRPMAYAGISDHRFYDRYCFGSISNDRRSGFFAGMGCYKNLNVMDGYIVIQHDNMQHNLRVSRILRPDIETTQVGPLRVEIIEPYRRLRLATDRNQSGIACDLLWTSNFNAHLESRHIVEIDQTIAQDNTRYDQCGNWTGWVEFEGQRIDAQDWWGFRDHSWGIRPGVGGFEPDRGKPVDDRGKLMSSRVRLLVWSCFSTADFSCQFQYHEDFAGNMTFCDGTLVYPFDAGKAPLTVKAITSDIDFLPKGQTYRSARHAVTLSDGSTLDIVVEPVLRTWAFGGTGYDGSYNDRRGLGAQRGDNVLEHDVFDMSDLEDVLYRDGSAAYAGHREQPGYATVNGQPAKGHFPAILRK